MGTRRFMMRRELQAGSTNTQTVGVADTFSLTRAETEQEICPIESYAPFYGYRFELPAATKPNNAQSHAADILYQIAVGIGAPTSDLTMRIMKVCDGDNCSEWYP